MKRVASWLLLASSLVLSASLASAAEPFRLVDGDRVALLGSTLIEREQRYGYWETALVSHYPQENIVFRNLGWSGDTVFGQARAGFGSTADGFRHLKDDVLAVKPTVILVGYGTNEAFEGEAGLPAFREGLRVLLDTLTPTKARIVLLAPPPQEDLGRPLPDPTQENRNLRLYRAALHQVAEQHGYPFVDLYDLLDDLKAKSPQPLTDNGIHLTAYGYWRTAEAVERGLGLTPACWLVEVEASGKTGEVQGTRLDKVQAGMLRFQATDTQLPPPPAPLSRDANGCCGCADWRRASTPSASTARWRPRRTRQRGLRV